MRMAYTYSLGVFLSFTLPILISISFTSTVTTLIPRRNKLSLRLIHRHSIFPTFYNPKVRSSVPGDDIRAPVIPLQDGTIFLVNVSIGEPPVPQLLAMDTGSRLLWVRCAQCEYGCKNVFDPKKSSTYTELSFNSPQCFNLVHSYRGKESHQCLYEIRYEDQSSSNGVLALEKFTFLTSTGGTVEVPDVMFGCALKIVGPAADLDGILGLENPNKYCLAGRNGNKFSYCIGNISDTQYVYNQLILGDGAILQGDSTPIRTKGSHYVVTLVGISVGEKQITINQDEFYYNVAIDSGTTYTLLVKSAYEPLLAEVENLLNGVLAPIRVGNAEDQLCYSGNLERDLRGFPIVTLHLSEGADLDLDVEALFHRTSDGSGFCMAVLESREGNLIGVKAQQYYNVGFDLDAMRVSFQRIDCELLED